MAKKLKNYITYIESKNLIDLDEAQKEKLRAEMLVQIGFFQHERLIHLIVTIAFAVFTLISIFACAAWPDSLIFLLTGIFMILLIAYIRHYYILENGVQKLYKYYDNI